MGHILPGVMREGRNKRKIFEEWHKVLQSVVRPRCEMDSEEQAHPDKPVTQMSFHYQALSSYKFDIKINTCMIMVSILN